MMNYLLPSIVTVLLAISFLKDRRKTVKALQIAAKRFAAVLPLFVTVILLMSLVSCFITESAIQRVLGATANRWTATALSALIGSVAIMPGFVAFPMGAVLRSNGVPYMVISAFTTTLMMVGILTFPIERAYLGGRVAVIRNVIGFIIALLVAVVTGIAFGEVRP